MMTGSRIDGVDIARGIKEGIKESVAILHRENVNPCLATILVGDDPASATYVRKKHEACAEVGIATVDQRLGDDTTKEMLKETIDRLNRDSSIHGILLQLPLPAHLDAAGAVAGISHRKDVDGLTVHNAGLLAAGKARLIPCTPLGVMHILDHCRIDLAGKTVVVIGRSSLVGKPLYHLLLQKDATVIACHSKTEKIRELCRLGDVVVTAVGNRNMFELEPDMLKDGCIVIDVAITRYCGRLTGDADYNRIIAKASRVTPVPGGVGPMTVAMLLRNTIVAAADLNGIDIKEGRRQKRD